MYIGSRLRQLREEKNMSQGDIQNKTGLLRCYISRVENGHTVPSLETLERFAAALDIPLYQLFYAGQELAQTFSMGSGTTLEELVKEGGRTGADARFLLKLKMLSARIGDQDREVLLALAKKLSSR